MAGPVGNPFRVRANELDVVGADLSLRELHRGDRLLICSDGLTDYAAEETVGEVLSQTDLTPGQVADQLIQLALRGSTRDNVTVIVADAVPSGDGTTRPQIVGAASQRRSSRGSPVPTPAEKAAQLSREASGVREEGPPVLAEEGPVHPALRWLRRILVTAAAVAVVGAAGWLGWGWSQSQYYVGVQDGQVTIYRGLAQDIGPWSLSEPEEQTDLAVDSLPGYYQDRVRRTLSASDRAGADTIVAELRALAEGSVVDDPASSTGEEGSTTGDQATGSVDPGQHPLTRLFDLGQQLGTQATSDAGVTP